VLSSSSYHCGCFCCCHVVGDGQICVMMKKKVFRFVVPVWMIGLRQRERIVGPSKKKCYYFYYSYF
jgi:hypothetical protein